MLTQINAISSINSSQSPYPSPPVVNISAANRFNALFRKYSVASPIPQNVGQTSASLWDSLLHQACSTHQNGNLVLPKELVVATLKARFGSALVKRTLKRYKLADHPSLTLTTLRCLLVGIAASVSKHDMRFHFTQLRHQGDARWNAFASYDDLEDDDIAALLDHFRKHISIHQWLQFSFSKKLPQYKILIKDLSFLKSCQDAKEFAFKRDQEVAISEYLGHEMAYADMQKGRIIPIRNDQGKLVFEKVTQFICKNGYVCSILTPMQELQHKHDFKVRILYRGTHDSLSASRLSEFDSAGHLSFNLNLQRLFNSIAAAIPKEADAVTVQWNGHSLGGADAQRGTEATAFVCAAVSSFSRPLSLQSDNIKRQMRYFRNLDFQRIRPQIEKIRHVEARVWNSAGIANSTNNRFKHWISYINDVTDTQQSDGDWQLVDPSVSAARVTFKICINKVHGDPVQRSGQATLGNGIGFDMPGLEREVYQFDHGFGGLRGCLCYLGRGGIKAHQVKNLNRRLNGGRIAPYRYENSKINHAKLERLTSDHLLRNIRCCTLWEKIKWFILTLLFGNPLRAALQEEQ